MGRVRLFNAFYACLMGYVIENTLFNVFNAKTPYHTQNETRDGFLDS